MSDVFLPRKASAFCFRFEIFVDMSLLQISRAELKFRVLTRLRSQRSHAFLTIESMGNSNVIFSRKVDGTGLEMMISDDERNSDGGTI